MNKLKFEELLDIAIKKTLDEIKTNLDEALVESKKLLDQSYTKILNEASLKINSLLIKKREQIEGEKAKLDIEVKRSILNEKNYWLGRVYEEIIKRLEIVTNSKEYQEGIKEIIKREAKQYAKLVCSKRDLDKVRSIVKELKLNLEVTADEKMLGGIKIYYPDVGLTRDYSLDLILNQIFETEKPKVAKILFGE